MNRLCCCLLSLFLAPVLWADEPTASAADSDTALDSASAESAPVRFDLPLTSVTLHAAGKGWFEYSGTVEGSRKFSVDVGTFEVDEAIRVSRVIDPAGGGEIRLAAAKDPIQPTPIVPNTRTLGDLLLSMKGQPIVATMHVGKDIEGTLVAIEQRTDRVGDVREDREYMTVLTGEGLRTSRVEDAASIRSTDEAFNEKLNAALSTLAKPSKLPTSQIEFIFAPGEKRKVTVGIMRRVPMWKVSYRIEGEKLIHRSIVDNTSGTDWSNVDLRLIDGNPVLFAMDMHSIARARIQHADRPESHVAMAPSFNETLSRAEGASDQTPLTATDTDNDRDGAADADFMESEIMGMGGMGGGMGGGGFGGGGFGGAAPPSRTSRKPDQPGLDSTAAMNHALAETQDAPAGSTLALDFQHVDLPSGETALLDTVVSPITIDDVSVYRQSYHPTATLLSLEIENDTPSLLPSGPLSVLAGEHHRAILGELVLPALGPKTKRLVGYAIDGGVRVTVEPTATKSETQSITLDQELHKIKIETLHQNVTDYEFLNRSGDQRTIILEVPAPDAPFEWVHEDEKNVTYERADQFDRVRFSLDDGQTDTHPITHQYTATDVKEWGTVAVSQLEEWIVTPKWDSNLKSELKSILQSRRELDETNATLADLLAMRNQLIQEIERVTTQLTRRYNGASLPKEVITQYQTRLIELENRREQSEQRMRDLDGTRRKCLSRLGMDPKLPPELLPLRAFIVDTDLIPADMPDVIQPDAENTSEKPSGTVDPFTPNNSPFDN